MLMRSLAPSTRPPVILLPLRDARAALAALKAKPVADTLFKKSLRSKELSDGIYFQFIEGDAKNGSAPILFWRAPGSRLEEKAEGNLKISNVVRFAGNLQECCQI